jgi:tetratricopeptide (TPR) repeat protein
MRKAVAALLLCASVSLVARAAHEVRPEHDRLAFGVVETVPGMDKVAVKTVVYKTVADRQLEMDVYSPPRARPGPRPAVVFVNGVGDFPGQRKVRTLGAVHDVAAPGRGLRHGRGDVRFPGRTTTTSPTSRTPWRTCAATGASWESIPARLAAWACSANVRSAMTVLMQPGAAPVQAAVLYYGAGDAPELRKDLPVLLARAGKDRPQMNAVLDRLAARALQANAPWTVLNVPGGHHAFDVLDDTEESRPPSGPRSPSCAPGWSPAPAAPQRTVNEGRAAAAHVMAGEWEEAEAAYARFVERDAKDVDALVFLASAQLELKKSAEAAVSLRKAVALDPDMGEAWSMLGRAEAEAKNYPAALEAVNKAIALDPADAEAHHQLGKVRLAQQDAPRRGGRAGEIGGAEPRERMGLAQPGARLPRGQAAGEGRLRLRARPPLCTAEPGAPLQHRLRLRALGRIRRRPSTCWTAPSPPATRTSRGCSPTPTWGACAPIPGSRRSSETGLTARIGSA